MIPSPCMRAGSCVLFALVSLPLASCRLLADSGVTYRDCTRDHYTEEFSKGATLKDLQERCWSVANAEEGLSEVFVDGGDLVIRVGAPADAHGERWLGAEQAPMLYQNLEHDFLVVARVEALNPISGDHCLAEDNQAGLVLRRNASDPDWATFLIGPFTLGPAPSGGVDCTGAAGPTPPVMGVVRSRDDAWGSPIIERGAEPHGIGVDGEADLAVCRLNGAVVFYYRDPLSTPDAPVWRKAGPKEQAPYDAGSGALDVGLTAAAAKQPFEVEGHFQWAVYIERIGADGCAGALEGLTLPPDQ